MDLFENKREGRNEPLAHRMRPRTLDEFYGQEHIVGKGRLLRRIIQADQLSSLIFYGPPGTGKTTLAQIIANTTKSLFVSLNAVLAGIADLRKAIDKAKEHFDLYDKRTILFIDEVHRWNKKQQDALLPWVENGTVILVGATTENPYFEVNSALVSRSRIFQLKQLEAEDLRGIIKQTLADKERGYGRYTVSIAKEAEDHLVRTANGDARSLLNALELAVETTPAKFPCDDGEKIEIDLFTAEESIQKKVVLYDKDGDYHYDTISAFIKSIRGSDPDAVLYWLAKMVRAGEDPRFIFRRMLISASEDIGLADPYALTVVESAASAFDRVGLPEGRFHLTHAALYLATAPKSNSSLGFFDALNAVEVEAKQEVPNHLKDGNRDKEGFGHGEGYLYPHAYKDHWVAQQYLPTTLANQVFYRPSENGYEERVKQSVERQREIQLSLMLSPSNEVLSNSPEDFQKKKWIQRALANNSKNKLNFLDEIFKALNLQRHQTITLCGDQISPFVWEALRQVPEGGVSALFLDRNEYELSKNYVEHFKEIDQPGFYLKETIDNIPDSSFLFHSDIYFITDEVEFQDIFSFLEHAKKSVVFKLRRLYQSGTHLSTLLQDYLEHDTLEKLTQFENAYFMQKDKEGEEILKKSLQHLNLIEQENITIPSRENRHLTKKFMQRWIDSDTSPFIVHLKTELDLYNSVKKCIELWQDSLVEWEQKTILLKFWKES